MEQPINKHKTHSRKAGLQAPSLLKLSENEIISALAPIFINDQINTGILASVSLAQFILESSFGKSELAQNANNLFGMKTMLSGNTWDGSAWDGVSIYKKETMEEYDHGVLTPVTRIFRKYSCLEDSITDHSSYLLGSTKYNKKRYEGLAGCSDYRKAIHIIKSGGYATNFNYERNLFIIINYYNLTRYDETE